MIKTKTNKATEITEKKHVRTLNAHNILKTSLAKKPNPEGCGECQASCQSACKTSCTVANQTRENK